MTKQIVVFPRGQLTARDKERMTKVGIMAVEADDPAAVRILNVAEPLGQSVITGDGIVTAALRGIVVGNDSATFRAFTQALEKAIAPTKAVEA